MLIIYFQFLLFYRICYILHKFVKWDNNLLGYYSQPFITLIEVSVFYVFSVLVFILAYVLTFFDYFLDIQNVVLGFSLLSFDNDVFDYYSVYNFTYIFLFSTFCQLTTALLLILEDSVSHCFLCSSMRKSKMEI